MSTEERRPLQHVPPAATVYNSNRINDSHRRISSRLKGPLVYIASMYNLKRVALVWRSNTVASLIKPSPSFFTRVYSE